MKLRHCILALIFCLIASGSCSAKCVNTAEIDLTWQPNPESDISHYVVYRASDGSTYSKVGETMTTAYTDVLPAEGTYSYVLAAVDLCGNISPLSDPKEYVFDPNAPIKPIW